MGITGIVFNNLTEIMALSFTLLLGYWLGRAMQKQWPHRHLRPWKWFQHRA